MRELLITIFLGPFGVHKFMQKKYRLGVLYLLTGGVFGIGWIIDILKAISNMISQPQTRKSNSIPFIKDNNTDLPNLIFSNIFLIVGDRYECRKNPKKMRAYVNKTINLNSAVHVERYYYQGMPAYMIVDSKSNLDLGVLSRGAASWLTDYYSKGRTEAFLIDRYKGTFHVKISVYDN